MKKLIVILILVSMFGHAYGQGVKATPEHIRALTSLWEGERFPDGRPKVSDSDLARLENCTLEQIQGYLARFGFRNQIELNWIVLKPGETMVGRALTCQYMPNRPDLDSLITRQGIIEGHARGSKNTWPIDMLTRDDIYVADGYLKVDGGTLIGSSLGNSILGRTGKGVLFYGSIRDMQELKETDGFNAWIKGHHPSAIRDMIPTSINAPIRIGDATVLPGDAVFANEYGVAFIPAHLLSGLVAQAALTDLRDRFERYMLQRATHPANEVHGTWNDEMRRLYREWFIATPDKLGVTIQQIDEYLERLRR